MDSQNEIARDDSIEKINDFLVTITGRMQTEEINATEVTYFLDIENVGSHVVIANETEEDVILLEQLENDYIVTSGEKEGDVIATYTVNDDDDEVRYMAFKDYDHSERVTPEDDVVDDDEDEVRLMAIKDYNHYERVTTEDDVDVDDGPSEGLDGTGSVVVSSCACYNSLSRDISNLDISFQELEVRTSVRPSKKRRKRRLFSPRRRRNRSRQKKRKIFLPIAADVRSIGLPRIQTWYYVEEENIAERPLVLSDNSRSSTHSIEGSFRNYRDSQMLDMNSSYLHVLNRICEEVHQEMAGKLKENGEIDWTVNVEVLFFYAMIGHKPVGVNRHFMMLLIHNKFSAYISHEISSKALWNHLDSMYDMAALHESEIIPFPNEEVDFELPEDCQELLRTKCGVSLKKTNIESESNKNSSSSSKSSKKLTPKLKQGAAVTTPKNTFASPVLSKPMKSQSSVKTETKTPTSDATPKGKELGQSAKINKVKRSSSPFTNKTKSEAAIKEDSPDISANKKSNKSERGNSPAVLKKPIKTELTPTNSSSKKPIKHESSVNGSKLAKPDTPDSSAKRDKKVEKDVASKKGKTPSSAEAPTKKHKVDATSSKKRTESESSSRKNSESSSVKSVKGDLKHSSHSNRDTETSTPGSRKSSPVVKVKGSESSKKLKRPKVEEPSKKLTPASKRRRQ